jgi:hypothetical protein
MEDAGACKVRVTDGTDRFLALISKTIRSNAGTLALVTVVTTVTAVALYAILKMMWDTVASYRARRASTPANGKKDEKARRKPAQYKDDIMYKDAASPDGLDPDLPREPEAAAIARKLKQITTRYAAYNRAISTYLRSRGKEPDDVIDKTIMSAANDDYRYSKADDEDDDPVFREPPKISAAYKVGVHIDAKPEGDHRRNRREATGSGRPEPET